MRHLLLLSLVAAVSVGACQRLTRENLNRHEVRTLAYWADFAKTPLVERLRLEAPAEVLDYLRKDNELLGFAERPIAARLSPDYAAEIKQAVAELPQTFQALVTDKVAGIIIVNNLGGSAYAEYLRGEDANGVSFVVLDAGVLDRPANDWASWRESSPFIADPAFGIVATIAPPDQNTRRIGVQMMLLHELAHVIGYAKGFHPRWDLPTSRRIEEFPFITLSWRWTDKRFVSRFDDEFTARREIHYYTAPGDKLPLARAAEVYTALEKTNFPHLFCALNPLDDFAEGLAIYAHTQVLKRPWQVQILRDNQPIKTYQACWDEPRCAEKRAFYAGLLGEER